VTLLATNPAKRRHELLVLAYSPVWMAAIGAMMFTRAFSRWGDAGHLAFGVALALPLWLLPLALPAPGERALPVAARHATRFTAWIALITFVQCAFGSELFFDALGMEYHFPVTWSLRGTPLFLYFVTIAYFSTYYVVMQVALRAIRARFPSAPAPVLWTVRALVGYAVAFAETASMATAALAPWFLYRRPHFALLVGSAAYGTLFAVTLPLLERLDEERTGDPPLARALWDLCAANLIALLAYEAWRLALRA
jgi:cycloeucalenol cycloisomerase